MLTNVVCLEQCLARISLSIMWVWALSHYCLRLLCSRSLRDSVPWQPSLTQGRPWHLSHADHMELLSATHSVSAIWVRGFWTDSEVWSFVPQLPNGAGHFSGAPRGGQLSAAGTALWPAALETSRQCPDQQWLITSVTSHLHRKDSQNKSVSV